MRLALRSLLKAPGYTAVIVLTLALGIGANTAIFSFFRGVLLRSLPFDQPERIVVFKKHAGDFREPTGNEVGVYSADFRELAPLARTLQSMATYTLDSATLLSRGAPDLAVAAVTTHNFFSVLGTRAILGRIFTEADAEANADRLAVISHRYWQTRFGGDPAVLGQSVTLNQIPFTVVGVMPPSFDFPREAQAWVTPAAAVPENQIGRPAADFGGRGNELRTIIGRLKPDVSREQAEVELATLVTQLPNPNGAQRSLHLITMTDQSVGNVRPALTMLLGCVALVLFLACLNVANLMLARATSRQREIGIRLALGASRWRIARQLLGESLLLALLGGITGLLLSGWILDLILHLAPDDIPRLTEVQIDGWVLVFAFAISMLTGLISGLAPILGTAKSDIISATRSGDRSGSCGIAPRRLRSILVSGEVAISLMLLVAAGLLLRSLGQMQDFSWGFEARHVISARVAFLGERYSTPEAQIAFHRALEEGLNTVPQFEAVGVSLDRIGQPWVNLPFTPEGHSYATPAERPQANYHLISHDYLRTLGISLQQGRYFTPQDDESAPAVAIIDATMAHRFFPAGDAVGRRIQIVRRDGNSWVEIIGVVAPVMTGGPVAPTQPDLYLHFLQRPWNNFFVHVRTSMDLATAGAILTRLVHQVDASLPVTDLASMEEITARPAKTRLFALSLLGAFAGLALILAAVGIYAVTAYGVSQRTREIGVRMALGAEPGTVRRLVLQQAFHPISWGLVVGLVGSAGSALAMQKLLFGIDPFDFTTFALVGSVLVGVAVLACWLPARRATKVDPMIALRAE